MYQLWLILTVITDIGATLALKMSCGLTRFSWALLALAGYGLSKYFFSLTLEKMSLGYAYTLWCGIGIVLACLIDFFYFKENINWSGWLGIACITGGICLIELSSQQN